MKRAPSGNGARAQHSGAAARYILPPGSQCDPSTYLRVRPPFRRYEKERQRTNHEALTQIERYLKALTAYRYHLDNPVIHRA